MIVNARGFVLSRRPAGEYDRIATLYTEDLGKITARFVGVSRPAGKLKALSEPAVWGEYRLHLSARADLAKCVGGSLIASFPGTRGDLARLTAALYCAELLERLTAERAPGPEKYRLMAAVLAALEEHPSRWLSLAFGLRLLDMAGFSLRERAPGSCARVWSALHEREPAGLTELAFDRNAAADARQALEAHIEEQTGRPILTARFREALRTAKPRAAPA